MSRDLYNPLRLISRTLAVASFVALVLPGGAAASDCASLKYRAAGAAAARKAKCKAKAVRTGAAVDAQCLARAEAKLARQWNRAENRGDCLTAGDEAALLAVVDSFITQLMSALEPPPPAAAGCCAIGGGICLASPPNSAQLCLDAGGTPGGPSEVCDAATGTCQTPPSGLGPCCEAGSCFSGPGVDSAGCAELMGSFFPSSSCLADLTCAMP